MIRLGGFVMRHRTIGPVIHSLVEGQWLRGPWRHRYAEHGCYVCRAVWAWLAVGMPEFAAAIDEGKAQHARGETVPLSEVFAEHQP